MHTIVVEGRRGPQPGVISQQRLHAAVEDREMRSAYTVSSSSTDSILFDLTEK